MEVRRKMGGDQDVGVADARRGAVNILSDLHDPIPLASALPQSPSNPLLFLPSVLIRPATPLSTTKTSPTICLFSPAKHLPAPSCQPIPQTYDVIFLVAVSTTMHCVKVRLYRGCYHDRRYLIQTIATANLQPASLCPVNTLTKIINIPLPERFLFSTFIFTDSTSQGSKDDKTMVRPGFEPETSRVHFKCETDVITNYTIEPLFKVETFYIPSRY